MIGDLRPAFEALTQCCPPWLAAAQDILNGSRVAEGVRALSVFPDDPELPPVPGRVGQWWDRWLSRVPVRQQALEDRACKLFPGHPTGMAFEYAALTKESGVYCAPFFEGVGHRDFIVVHDPLKSLTPYPGVHDPERGKACVDGLRQSRFFELVGYALGEGVRSSEGARKREAEQFAVEMLLLGGKQAQVEDYVSVRLLEELRRPNAKVAHGLALARQAGLVDKEVCAYDERADVQDVFARLARPACPVFVVQCAPEYRSLVRDLPGSSSLPVPSKKFREMLARLPEVEDDMSTFCARTLVPLLRRGAQRLGLIG